MTTENQATPQGVKFNAHLCDMMGYTREVVELKSTDLRAAKREATDLWMRKKAATVAIMIRDKRMIRVAVKRWDTQRWHNDDTMAYA